MSGLGCWLRRLRLLGAGILCNLSHHSVGRHEPCHQDHQRQYGFSPVHSLHPTHIFLIDVSILDKDSHFSNMTKSSLPLPILQIWS